MLNLAVLLEASAREVAGRDAVVHGTTRLTYAELDAAASQLASALVARGIQPGDRIALSCPNLPCFAVVYYGILKAGAVIVPLNILLTEREIAYHLADSAARAYFCFEGTAELPMGKAGSAAYQSTGSCEHFVLLTAEPAAASPMPEVETLAEFVHRQPATFTSAATAETDTAVILYTSGTTGKPKGAELTHSNMVQNALLANRLFGMHPHDVHLVALPLFHSFGQSVQMNAGLATGATVVLLPRFDAELALSLMEREQVTFFAGVPTMYHALLSCAHAGRFDLAGIAAGLRVAVSGGAALPAEVMRGFEERFGVPILEGYGLSETSPVATFNRVSRPRRPGSVGLPAWGIEVMIVRDDGSEAEVGEPGEIMIRGRFNVYPRELEEVLHTHADVSLAAVVGVPHDRLGEEVKAFVVRNPGAAISEAELISWCKQNMAAYKHPRLVEFRDSLPMTATGKILKRELGSETAPVRGRP